MKTMPNAAQLDALIRFAEAGGRRWKTELNAWWLNGSGIGVYAPELQQVRNAHGPAWLSRVTLAELKAARAAL